MYYHGKISKDKNKIVEQQVLNGSIFINVISNSKEAERVGTKL